MDFLRWLRPQDEGAPKKWTPSELTEPLQVYTQAIADRKAGRYADALAKLLWFREHALERSSAFAGVRNSFALAEWHELGGYYRPAMVALFQAREIAERQVREKPDRSSFADMASLNRCLEEPERIVRIFSELAARSPDAARECYDIAERYLLAHGEHGQCNLFLDVEARMAKASQFYAEMKQYLEELGDLETDEDGDEPMGAADEYLMNEITPLVTLLARNDRHEEAKHVCQTALAMLPDKAFESRLNAALRGELPE